MAKKTVIMKGDGIGPEVVDSMLRVLKECNTQIEIINCEAGLEQWEKNGSRETIRNDQVIMVWVKYWLARPLIFHLVR